MRINCQPASSASPSPSFRSDFPPKAKFDGSAHTTPNACPVSQESSHTRERKRRKRTTEGPIRCNTCKQAISYTLRISSVFCHMLTNLFRFRRLFQSFQVFSVTTPCGCMLSFHHFPSPPDLSKPSLSLPRGRPAPPLSLSVLSLPSLSPSLSGVDLVCRLNSRSPQQPSL
jgi:hypothetical protein